MCNYSLYHGDCFDFFPSIADKSIDMILCDLPYGTTANEWDTRLPIDTLWQQYNRVIKDNGAIILFADMKFAVDLIAANRKYFRYDLIWEKSCPVGFLLSKKMPLRSHELLLVFYKKLPVYSPQGLVKGKNSGGDESGMNCYHLKRRPNTRGELTNYPRSIWRFAKAESHQGNKETHPTQKPLALLRELILTYSNPNDVILDNCMGSGSTVVAALQAGRCAIGIEKDTAWFQHAQERITRECSTEI